MSDIPSSKPKLPIPVIRPSGTGKKPLPPGVNPMEVMRVSQTAVFRPKVEVRMEDTVDDAPTEWKKGAEAQPPPLPPGAAQQGAGLLKLPSGELLHALPADVVDAEKVGGAQLPPELVFDATAILPQLSQGRVTVSLQELAAQVPPEILRAGLDPNMPVRIPLPLIVSHLSPEMLQIKDQEVQHIDPDFVKSPFSEGRRSSAAKPDASEAAPRAEPPGEESSAPQQDAAPAPMTEEAVASEPAPTEAPAEAASATTPSIDVQPDEPARPETARIPAALAHQVTHSEEPQAAPDPEPEPEPVPDAPSEPDISAIEFDLGTVLSRAPDELFAGTKERADASALVSIPVEWVLPQLLTGKVGLTFEQLYPMLPEGLAVPVTDSNKDKLIPLPLDRVVMKIPAHMLGGSAAAAPIPDDPDIPANLFTERRARATSKATMTSPPGGTRLVPDVEPPPAHKVFEAPPAPAPLPPTAAKPAAAIPAPVAPPPAPDMPVPGEAMAAESASEPAPEPQAAVESPPEPVPVPEPKAAAAAIPEPPAEPGRLEVTPTGTEWDEATILDRLNRWDAAQLGEIDGLSPQDAARILEARKAKPTLEASDLAALGLTRKALLRLASQPEPEPAGVPVLNRLLNLRDGRTLKVQEILETAVKNFGVSAGMLVAEDGLILAGGPPQGYDKQMISAFIPQIFRHLAHGMDSSGMGRVSRCTLLLENEVISLFRASGIFVLFWHGREQGTPASFKRMERLTEELSGQHLSAA